MEDVVGGEVLQNALVLCAVSARLGEVDRLIVYPVKSLIGF